MTRDPLERPKRHGFVRLALPLLLLVLGLSRAALLDRGVQSIPDELIYYDAALAWERGLLTEPRAACRLLSSTHARPGASVLSLVPVAAQSALRRATGRAYANPESLRLPLAWNLLVSLLLAWTFYRLALRLLGGPRAAFLASACWGLLVNTNLYVRHLLPYDTALLLHLLALERALVALGDRPRTAWRNALLAGLLLGAAHTTYPGYYAFPAVVAGLLLLHPTGPLLDRLPLLLILGAGAVVPLAACEAMARAGGGSYLFASARMAGTITLGAADEAPLFLPRYLLEVEGPVGAALLALAAWLTLRASAVRATDAGRGGPPRTLGILLGLVLAAYALHAAVAVTTGRLVFYGRLIHLHYPFLVLAAVAGLRALPRGTPRRAATWLLLGLACAGWVRFWPEYRRLGYPRDVLFALGVDSVALPPGQRLDEWQEEVRHIHRPPGTVPRLDPRRLVLVNFSFLPLEPAGWAPHVAPPGARVLYAGEHFEGFPAYTFEGSSPTGRAFLRERRPRLLVYELPAEGPPR